MSNRSQCVARLPAKSGKNDVSDMNQNLAQVKKYQSKFHQRERQNYTGKP